MAIRFPLIAGGGVQQTDFSPLGQIGADFQRSQRNAAALRDMAEQRQDRALARQEAAENREFLKTVDFSDPQAASVALMQRGMFQPASTVANIARQDAANEIARRRLKLAQAQAGRGQTQAANTRQAQIDFLVGQGRSPQEATTIVDAGLAGAATKGAFEQPDPTETAKAATALRKEFAGRQDVKDFQKVAGSYDRMNAVFPDRQNLANATGAQDIALVFSYMKLLDPTSVVREGEQASAANAAGVPSAVRSMYNRVLGGGTLDETSRAQMLDAGDQVFGAATESIRPVVDQFGRVATGQGVNPADVLNVGRFQPRQGTQATDRDVDDLVNRYSD